MGISRQPSALYPLPDTTHDAQAMTRPTTLFLRFFTAIGLILVFSTSSANQDQESTPTNPCEALLTADDRLRFNQTHINVPQSCTTFTVTLQHIGRLPKVVTPQNWVLTTRPYLETVARAAFQAGEANNWTAPDSEHILAATPLIGRGETAQVILQVQDLDPETDYRFLSTVGGHSPRMRGTLRVVP